MRARGRQPARPRRSSAYRTQKNLTRMSGGALSLHAHPGTGAAERRQNRHESRDESKRAQTAQSTPEVEATPLPSGSAQAPGALDLSTPRGFAARGRAPAITHGGRYGHTICAPMRFSYDCTVNPVHSTCRDPRSLYKVKGTVLGEGVG
eukprot:6701754-Prymnesium_polylepis.1